MDEIIRTSAFIQKTFAWIIPLIAFPLTALGVWIAIRNARKAHKAFSYQKLTDVPLFSKDKIGPGKMEVTYDGKAVENIRVVEVKLSNSGGKEIEAKDFAEPVKLSFIHNTQLFDPVVTGTFPASFHPAIELDGSSIIMRPCLMNPGDWLTVKVLVASDGPVGVLPEGRISGIIEIIEHLPRVRQRYIALRMYAWAAGIVASIIVVLVFTPVVARIASLQLFFIYLACLLSWTAGVFWTMAEERRE